MVGADLLGAVDLLDEDEADELMGEYERAEGEREVGAGFEFGADAVSAADDEGGGFGRGEVAGEEVGELRRGELFAGFVEEDDEVGRGKFGEDLGGFGLDWVGVRRVSEESPIEVEGAAEAFFVVGDGGREEGVVAFADGDDADHEGIVA